MSTIKLYAYSHIEDNKEQIKLNNNIQIIADNLHNSKKYRDTHNMTELSNYDKYYYDIELVNTGSSVVTRLLQGVARVTPEVTR